MKDLILNLLVGALAIGALVTAMYLLGTYLYTVLLAFGALIVVGVVISVGAFIRGVWRDV